MYLIGSIKLHSDPHFGRSTAMFALANPSSGVVGNQFKRQSDAIEAISLLGVVAQAWPLSLLASMGLWDGDGLRHCVYAAETEMRFSV